MPKTLSCKYLMDSGLNDIDIGNGRKFYFQYNQVHKDCLDVINLFVFEMNGKYFFSSERLDYPDNYFLMWQDVAKQIHDAEILSVIKKIIDILKLV